MGVSLAVAAFLPAVGGQSPVRGSATVQAANFAPVHTVREIRDPNTGLSWRLERDTRNPAGPGRMVAAAQDPMAQPKPLVIRSGDAVLVEERTPIVEGSLEAVALEAAAAGSRFNVRLKIGGGVVRAVALAPGRAALVPFGEAWP